MGLTTRLRESKPSVLVGVGIVLFVFPEPATSTIGIALALLGAVWWFDLWGDSAEESGQ